MGQERNRPVPEADIQLKERTVSVSPRDLTFFIWSLGGYDNLCTAEIVREQRGKVSLWYPGNMESEVLQVVESLFREMTDTGSIEQEIRL